MSTTVSKPRAEIKDNLESFSENSDLSIDIFDAWDNLNN